MPQLSEFPSGGTAFLDANILLGHLLARDFSYRDFFLRAQARELSAVTSVTVLAEVRHRVLLTEAVRRGYVSPTQRALEVLRSHPEIIGRLHDCDPGLNWLLEIPLRIVSVTPAQFRAAQRISLRYHLLTNDALHVATMRAHGLRHLASADSDFDRVPRLVRWAP